MLRRFVSQLRDQWMGALALFLVLSGGTAYAVTQIDRNSVKSKHIVDGQVKSSDVQDDGLTGVDIDESGLESLLGSPVVVRTTVIPAATVGGQGTTRPEDSSARCDEGEQLLSGGYGETTPSTTTTGLGDTYHVGFACPGIVEPNPDFPAQAKQRRGWSRRQPAKPPTPIDSGWKLKATPTTQR